MLKDSNKVVQLKVEYKKTNVKSLNKDFNVEYIKDFKIEKGLEIIKKELGFINSYSYPDIIA